MRVSFTSSPADSDVDLSFQPKPQGLYREVCLIPGNLLNSGAYRIWLLIVADASRVIFRLEDCVGFEVLDLGARTGTWYGKEPGFVRPILDWQTEQLPGLPLGEQ